MIKNYEKIDGQKRSLWTEVHCQTKQKKTNKDVINSICWSILRISELEYHITHESYEFNMIIILNIKRRDFYVDTCF